MKMLFAYCVSLLALTACSTYSANRYSPSTDNILAFKALKGRSINVGAFTASTPAQDRIACRAAGPIKTPDGETYSEYIRKAMIDEMKLAEIYDAKTPVTLTGNLNSLDFDSMGGLWKINMTLSSSNGKSMTVNEQYKYSASFFAESGCANTAQAFTPAVQNMVGKAIAAPEFRTLIK